MSGTAHNVQNVWALEEIGIIKRVNGLQMKTATFVMVKGSRK